MAGTISLSLSQQFDSLGKPLSGGKLFFYKAATVAQPQSAFSDTALTLELPNPITLDSAGRVPQFFLADGRIKIILKDVNGVTQVSADNILVIGASAGDGSSGDAVDATTVAKTGDLKHRYGTGSHTGWVRANGRTIGSATSGASERANTDCEALFEYLWATDTNLTVTGGRGSTAAAEWAADKSIALPDLRGRALVGLDDMGNTAASRLTSTYFGTDATVLGAAGGSESHTLTTAQTPSHTHAFTGDALAAHSHTVNARGFGSGGVTFDGQNGIGPQNLATSSVSAGTPSGTNSSVGGGGAHNNASPAMAVTIYVKL